MDPLSPENYAQASKTQSLCPFCRGNNIEGDSYDHDSAGVMTQEMSCPDCGKFWVDIYTLTSFEGRE